MPGLIGIEDDDPANLLHAGVLTIGFAGSIVVTTIAGSIVARLQPRGLSRAMFATALAQAVAGAIALALPNTAGPVQIVVLHGLFVALFAGAALLFRYAALPYSPPSGSAMNR